MTRTTYVFAAIASLAACVPSYQFTGDTNDAQPPPVDAGDASRGSPVDASPDALDAGAMPLDAPADVVQVDAIGGDGGPLTLLLAPAGAPTSVPDASVPWESHTVWVIRGSATSHLELARNADGGDQLYVDDNIHVVVTPLGSKTSDQYYEFYTNYPCPAQSTTKPPGGDGSGGSPPIDITSLFATDMTTPQEVTLEFWHCAPHIPAPHSDFWLLER